MVKELGIILIKTSIFFSDIMLKRTDNFIEVIGCLYLGVLIIFLIFQICVTIENESNFWDYKLIIKNKSNFSKYSLITYPLTLITQFIIYTLSCIICIQLCYLSIIPFIIYIILSILYASENREHSIYEITPTITTYFNLLQERDSTLKQYKIDYQNTIKKSENLWKTHKLS